EKLLTAETQDLDLDQFTNVFVHPTPTGNVELPLTYEFKPRALLVADASRTRSSQEPQTDGFTFTIPLALLHYLDHQHFDWLTLVLRVELITALTRGLPKTIRKHLVPAPDTAKAAAEALASSADPTVDNFYEALGTFFRQTKHQPVGLQDWNVHNL